MTNAKKTEKSETQKIIEENIQRGIEWLNENPDIRIPLERVPFIGGLMGKKIVNLPKKLTNYVQQFSEIRKQDCIFLRLWKN